MLKNPSMCKKLICIFIYASVLTLLAHMITYKSINDHIKQFDLVYASNSNLSELSTALDDVQNSMYQYLKLKSSSDLEAYYQSVQAYTNLLATLNDKVVDNRWKMMEFTVHQMSMTYLQNTTDAVQAKRGRNINKYNECYCKAEELYNYIKQYIQNLNNECFQYNSKNYLQMRQSLHYTEMVSTFVLLIIISLNAMMIVVLTSRITKPLDMLSKQADELAKGNFEVKPIHIYTGDEIEILAKAFNKMIISINQYISTLKERMFIESQMKEKELLMENHLKDAELKYLQAQVNPHFLFNTLNAGMQLAYMEEAERTASFIENMAAFYRYNLTKSNKRTTLGEEVGIVDHYIYILNVRFSGAVSYVKEIDHTCLDVVVPGMIIQPIVENVFQYGIRDISWEGKIRLSVTRDKNKVQVAIADNGRGMSQEKINEIMQGKLEDDHNEKTSNGIGLSNVINRLRLFYGIEEVIMIKSEGKDKGTEVILMLPIKQEEKC